MKIFGIGLSRTGTKSLTAALQRLGYRIVHFPTDRKTYRDLAGGTCRFSILERYDGITDITCIPYIRCLDTLYAGSKFLLTVRDKKSWLESMEKHLALNPLSRKLPDILTERKVRRLLRLKVYGRIDYEAGSFSRLYDDHNAFVQSYFDGRPSQFLVLNIIAGEGWERLCSFLGKPVPQEPFPHM